MLILVSAIVSFMSLPIPRIPIRLSVRISSVLVTAFCLIKLILAPESIKSSEFPELNSFDLTNTVGESLLGIVTIFALSNLFIRPSSRWHGRRDWSLKVRFRLF